MNIGLQTIGILILLSTSTARLSAQDNPDEYGDLVENADSVIWARTFTGTIDFIFPVELELIFDGYKYSGKMRYGDDGDESLLTGVGIGQSFVLEEITTNGNKVAEIRGEVADGNLVANWTSDNGSRQFTLRTLDKELVRLNDFNPFFKAFVDEGKTTTVQLNHDHPQLVSGILGTPIGAFRLMGQCIKPDCNDVKLHILEGPYRGNILNIYDSRSSTRRLFGYPDDDSLIELEETASYEVVHESFCNYTTMVDFSCIKTGNGDIDSVILKQFLVWSESVRDYGERALMETAGNRWCLSASAWMDVFHSSEKWVSGLMTFYNPADTSYESSAFIYDLDKGREIPAGNIFRDITFITEIETVKSTDAELTNVVLSSDGIDYRSDFNSHNGYEYTFVAYKDLPEGMLKRSFLKKYIEVR